MTKTSGTALPRYDQALRNACNDKKIVKLTLALATSWTDEEGDFVCRVLEVDKFSVKVEFSNGRTRWIAKSWIVGTEIEG